MNDGMQTDKVSNPGLTTERPVTDVNKKKKAIGRGEEDFNTSVIIIGVAWAVLAFLVFSLREYNI